MVHAEGSWGRVFVLRLEEGDRVPECIERFAAEQGVSRAVCWFRGGIGAGKLVVGPARGEERPVTPLVHLVEDVHEAAAVGTLFPAEDGSARLHMHASLGRHGQTHTGCVRKGLDVWQVGEVVVLEITGVEWVRKMNPETGFEMLQDR